MAIDILENKMKKLFTPVMALASVLACANVSAEQILISDFNDGTNQGWVKGAPQKSR